MSTRGNVSFMQGDEELARVYVGGRANPELITASFELFLRAILDRGPRLALQHAGELAAHYVAWLLANTHRPSDPPRDVNDLHGIAICKVGGDYEDGPPAYIYRVTCEKGRHPTIEWRGFHDIDWQPEIQRENPRADEVARERAWIGPRVST